MRQLIFFAVALVVAGSYMARFADRAVEARPEPQAAVLEPANDLREPTTSGRSLMLESDRQGHFQVEARVEGRFVDFVVDTGASLVVLRESSAAARLHGYGRHRQRQDQGRAGEDRSYRSRRYHGL